MDNHHYYLKPKDGATTVCVTGASGFVASWLVKRLLLSGYHVRGTVRDPDNERKVAHLWKLEGATERLKLLKADLMEEGSFDHAIMGCRGVFHTASPVLGAVSDPREEILDPAIEGTLNVLRSCERNPYLQRVVLTSSSSAVRIKANVDVQVPLDETSWSCAQLCEKHKLWYALAKMLAERAAWEFAAEKKIDLVSVIPSFVVGPSLSPDLGQTALDVLHLLQGESEKFSRYGRMGYVHIDDVARCHILLLENATSQGRYLCSSSTLDNHELASLLTKQYPSLAIPSRFDAPYGELHYPYELDTSKLDKLGFQFQGVEEMFRDCVESLQEHGYLTL